MSNVKVTSHITLDTTKLMALDKATLDAMVLAADATLTDLKNSGTMPFNKGTLQNNSTTVDDSSKLAGKVSIVSTTPYARRLYYHPEFKFRKSFNRNAGARWFEPYLKNGFIVKAFAQLMKRKL